MIDLCSLPIRRGRFIGPIYRSLPRTSHRQIQPCGEGRLYHPLPGFSSRAGMNRHTRILSHSPWLRILIYRVEPAYAPLGTPVSKPNLQRADALVPHIVASLLSTLACRPVGRGRFGTVQEVPDWLKRPHRQYATGYSALSQY